ncbi:MAG: hypothetical protein HKN29_15485 [Rhodothermales bacterium]|nr:hypothetical protein [Rhodothermales bacterium]
MTETRAELEARLQSASDSMSRRLTAMEEEVKLPTVAKLANAGSNGILKKAAIAAGVGLAVGIIFGGGRKKAPSKPSPGFADWREDLTDAITEFLRDGNSPEEAARKAARSVPPVSLKDDSDVAEKGLLAVLFAFLLRTGLNVGMRELVKRLSDRNDEPQAS